MEEVFDGSNSTHRSKSKSLSVELDRPDLPVLTEEVISKAKKESVLFKVLVLGDSGVGKSSFLKVYSGASCPKEYKKTFGVDFVSKHVSLTESFDVDLHFWDLSGYLQKDQLLTYFRDAKGAIIIFDDRPESKANIIKWKQLLDEKVTSKGSRYVPPVVLVENKIDLKCSKSDDYNREELNAIASQLEFRGAYPCSVAAGWNVQPAVKRLLQEMVSDLKTRHDTTSFEENQDLWDLIEKPVEEESTKCVLQ